MNRSAQIGFILLFLAIIYTVPVVQTVYEYRTNPDHRIQMLDLPRDLFVTPSEKKANDASLIDSILLAIGNLEKELGRAAAPVVDSTNSWDPAAAIEIGEAAAIRITILRKNAVDYNRHVTGAANRFAAQDTVKPYYSLLTKLGRGFEELLTGLQADPPDLAGLSEKAGQLKSTALELRQSVAGRSYLALTLTALRRIMVGANYLRPYESEMEKGSLFATTLRPWMLYGYFHAFGDFGNKGVKGANGWLFYRPDVDYVIRPDVFDPRSRTVDANDIALTEDIVGTIVDFKEQLATRGIDLLFVVMPGKPSIYPDLLSPEVKPELSGTIGHSQTVIGRLRNAGIETVDLFSAFAKERANDASCGDSLYLHTDTHFKGRGVLTAARAVAERVRAYPWFKPGTAEFTVDTVVVPRFGDVGEMIGLPASVVAKRQPPFAAESTVCYQVYQVRKNSDGMVSRKALYKDDYRGSDILVLGDSFSRMYQTDQPKSAGWISHLAREIGRPVASLVNDGGASTLVRQSLARKPGLLKKKKLVIWEVVERDFRFGEEGWKKIEVVKR